MDTKTDPLATAMRTRVRAQLAALRKKRGTLGGKFYSFLKFDLFGHLSVEDIQFSCLHCEKTYGASTAWDCGYCRGHHHGAIDKMKSASVCERCDFCGNEAAAFKCAACQKDTVFVRSKYDPTSGVGTALVHEGGLLNLLGLVVQLSEARKAEKAEAERALKNKPGGERRTGFEPLDKDLE